VVWAAAVWATVNETKDSNDRVMDFFMNSPIDRPGLEPDRALHHRGRGRSENARELHGSSALYV
jgi:hypothetical protein